MCGFVSVNPRWGGFSASEYISLAESVSGLRLEIENLIMERINDREHIDVFNGMIAKREEEIAQLQRSIEEYRDYDKVCKQRKNELRDSALVLETIIRDYFH